MIKHVENINTGTYNVIELHLKTFEYLVISILQDYPREDSSEKIPEFNKLYYAIY